MKRENLIKLLSFLDFLLAGAFVGLCICYFYDVSDIDYAKWMAITGNLFMFVSGLYSINLIKMFKELIIEVKDDLAAEKEGENK